MKYEVAENFVDSTSMISITMPINTAIELFWANMSNEVSLNSRACNLALTYAGFTRVLKFRDYTKNKFNIDSLPGYVRAGHDLAYGLTVGPIIKTGIYLAAGETDWKKIAISVGVSTIAMGAVAIPVGWMVDVGRDLWGIKESPRTPKFLKEKSSRFKKAVAIGALAASVTATGLVYGANYLRTHNTPENNYIGLEKVVDAGAN